MITLASSFHQRCSLSKASTFSIDCTQSKTRFHQRCSLSKASTVPLHAKPLVFSCALKILLFFIWLLFPLGQASQAPPETAQLGADVFPGGLHGDAGHDAGKDEGDDDPDGPLGVCWPVEGSQGDEAAEEENARRGPARGPAVVDQDPKAGSEHDAEQQRRGPRGCSTPLADLLQRFPAPGEDGRLTVRSRPGQGLEGEQAEEECERRAEQSEPADQAVTAALGGVFHMVAGAFDLLGEQSPFLDGAALVQQPLEQLGRLDLRGRLGEP